MLVLHVASDGEWEEIYYGPFAPVKAGSRHSARDNKEMISMSKLRAMKVLLDTQGTQAAAVGAVLISNDVTEPIEAAD